MEKREELVKEYKNLGKEVNPLMLIQLRTMTRISLTQERAQRKKS